MKPRSRRRAMILWLFGAAIVWNGIFDFVQTRGIKDYLLRSAMHELGRGPQISLPAAMELVTRDAIWISTLWACSFLLAGLVTIRIGTRAAD